MVKTEEKGTKKKKEFIKLMMKEEIEIVRIVIENKEKYLIEIRTVEEMVSERFHYLRMFKKKDSITNFIQLVFLQSVN